MIWIPVLTFVLVFAVAAGAYYFLSPGRTETTEIKKRISLLELRGLQGSEVPDVLKEELLSDVPLLHRLLSHIKVATDIDRRLLQADMKVRVGTFVLVSFSLLFAGYLMGRLLHWPAVIAIALGVGLFLVPNTVVNIKRRLRLKKFMNHFPEALEMFARSLRAGHSFTGAIQLVAQEMPYPVGPEFSRVFEEQNLGIPLRQALLGLSERVDTLDVRFFVTAILIQRETGGNLSEIIDKIAHVIRERFRIQGQLKIYTAQARMSGFVIGALPVGMALLIGILNPEYLKPLWFDRTGNIMVVAAVIMQVLGVLAIRKIIRIKI